eukprot:comp19966_c0_seq1/m.38946 comp19966_c0_seq1/g.38946  ORF comp19966_c0_seq1/g.38946 comp19966_c0_seq1/m.38946 type:complete len:325 (+) comp19966_c0_seq1:474-1448(+)
MVEKRELGRDHEVVDAALAFGLELRGKIVELAQIAGLGDVSEGGKAALCHEQIALVEGHDGKRAPHGLDFRGCLCLVLEDAHGALKVVVFDGCAKLNEGLVERVCDFLEALVDNDLGAVVCAHDFLDVAVDLDGLDAVWGVDRVPHGEGGAVLGDNDVAVGHPLDVLAPGEQGGLFGRSDIDEIEMALAVAEEQLGCMAVELKPVDPDVVGDGGFDAARGDVHDDDGLEVDEIGDLFHAVAGCLFRLADAHGDEMGADVLGAAGAEDFVDAVLDEAELAGVEDHAGVRVVEAELFAPAAVPLDLAGPRMSAVGRHVADDEGLCR